MPVCVAHLKGAAGDKVIDNCPLPLSRPEDPSHPLHIFARALTAAHHNRNVGGRHVEPLVQHARADEDAQLAFGKKFQGPRALRRSDIAGDGLNEVLASDGVRRFVIRGKHQDPGIAVPQEQVADGSSLLDAKPDNRAGVTPGRERSPARIAPAREGAEILLDVKARVFGIHQTRRDFILQMC